MNENLAAIERVKLRLQQKDKSWITFLVLSVIAVLYAFRSDSTWQFLLMTTLVILVHEGGHALAMKAMGYTDVKVFMFPLFGGLTTGKPSDHSQYKSAIVTIFGPLIGFGFAIGCTIYAMAFSSRLLLEMAVIGYVINAINLVPVSPLDGGEIVKSMISGASLRAKKTFRYVSIVGMGLLAWYLQTYLLGIVAFFMLTSTPFHNKSLLLAQQIRQQGFTTILNEEAMEIARNLIENDSQLSKIESERAETNILTALEQQVGEVALTRREQAVVSLLYGVMLCLTVPALYGILN